MKKTFTMFNGEDTYQAYWNEKEYGAAKTRYTTITHLSGSRGQRETKGAYSATNETFTQYNDLDLVKAAAQALGWTE